MKHWLPPLVGLVLFAVLLAGQAAAESNEPDFAQAPRMVEVKATGNAEAVAALEKRTRALLQDYPVVVEWSVVAAFRPRDVFEKGAHAGLVRIWLDAREPSHVVLYLVDDAHERFLVRVVPLDAGYDEVAAESVGTIVQSSVEALLAGATLGVSRAAAEEQVSKLEGAAPAESPPEPPVGAGPAVQAEPKPPLAEPYRFTLDVSYRGQMLHEGPEILHGPEIGTSIARWHERLSATGFLSLGYRLPLDWQEQGVGARFQGLGVRGGPGLRIALGRHARLGLLGVVGFDWLEVVPTVSAAAADPRDAFWIASPMLGLMLEGEVDLARSLAIFLSAGAEVDLLGHHFDVIEAGQPVTVLQAWRVQPTLRVGLRLHP